MQGVFPRFRHKKALKEAVKANEPVRLEATSLLGNEYDGDLYQAPPGKYFVVGPDPFTKRNWYASIEIKNGMITVK